MHRRTLILLAIVLLLVVAVIWRWSKFLGGSRRPGRGQGHSAVTPDDPNHPNVLLISLDTLRPDHLSCYGYGRPTTPNLDRFAQTAARFSQVRAQAPWTLASHMSLFTSMLPSSSGIDQPVNSLAPGLSTFVQPLQAAGYNTQAIVHRGNLDKSWGFARGYDDRYEEYPIWEESRTLDGRAEVVTGRALQWLAKAPRKPWHLFLHYFDAHHPYWSPEPFHSTFGAVPIEETVPLIFDHRWPNTPFDHPGDRDKLINSYDASIAYMDFQLGKVLDAVPPNTLVVIFSDHGEAFKEHGWTWHASTVYEEEIRTMLMIRPPEHSPYAPEFKPRVIDEPVMLLDVAPTILAQVGIPALPTFEGTNLTPLLEGGKIDGRPIASENKSSIVGDLSKSLVLYPWKMIYHLDSGKEELYKLPDETTNRVATEKEMAASLRESLRGWVKKESFWIISFTGDAELTGSIKVTNGSFLTLVPLADGGSIQGGFKEGSDVAKTPWQFHAHPGERVQSVFIQTDPPNAALTADLEINGKITSAQLSVGKSGTHPSEIPDEYWIGPPGEVAPSTGQRLSLGEQELLPSYIDTPFHPTTTGYYIRRFGNPPPGSNVPGRRGVPMIDQKVLDVLRSSGYLEGGSRH